MVPEETSASPKSFPWEKTPRRWQSVVLLPSHLGFIHNTIHLTGGTKHKSSGEQPRFNFAMRHGNG